MHILVTTHAGGGVWTYTRELVTGLARRGVRVTLVSFGAIPTPEQTAWMDGLKDLDYRPTAFRLEWMQEAEADLEESAAFLETLIREVRPDLLHLSQYFYGAVSGDVPRLVVAHSDVVSWWVSVHGQEPRDSAWTRHYREAVSRGLARADAVVAPSRWMLECLRAYYTAPANACIVHHGRTPTLFNPHVSKEDSLVTVGRLWDPGKQTMLLARHQHPLTVFVVGPETHDTTFPDADTGGHDISRLYLKGPQSEVQLRTLLGRASLYAATARCEVFGLSVVEAALSRCAIIANDIPTFRELWGDAACYFRRNDAESLAAAIRQLHTDRELRLTYANLAYNRARQRFTAARMVDEYLSLYQRLVPAEALAA